MIHSDDIFEFFIFIQIKTISVKLGDEQEMKVNGKDVDDGPCEGKKRLR